MSLLGGGGGASKARVTMSFYMTFFYFDGVPYLQWQLGLFETTRYAKVGSDKNKTIIILNNNPACLKNWAVGKCFWVANL